MSARKIECPDCGQPVELSESNVIQTHDNAPPLRSVCMTSGADATGFVAMLDRAIAQAAAAERARCAAVAQRVADALADDSNKYARTVALKIASDIANGGAK